jgi:hypothetical protein
MANCVQFMRNVFPSRSQVQLWEWPISTSTAFGLEPVSLEVEILLTFLQGWGRELQAKAKHSKPSAL